MNTTYLKMQIYIIIKFMENVSSGGLNKLRNITFNLVQY